MSKMKLVIIAILAGYVFMRTQGCDISPSPDVPVTPVPEVPVIVLPEVDEPKLDMKSVVEDIVEVDFEAEDAAILAEYFMTLGGIVEADEETIKTTGNLRTYIGTSGSLTFAGTDMNDKYSVDKKSLGAFVNEGLADAIGKKNVSISDEQREAAAEFFDAVAWAIVVPDETPDEVDNE